MRAWSEALPVEPLEQFRLQSDLDAVAFAQAQKARIETYLAQVAARDDRVPLLAQIPGIGFINAITILAAIGDIKRFPTVNQLVGYAGLGTTVHDSGQLQWRGRITKLGRRDLRRAMVEAASRRHATTPTGGPSTAVWANKRPPRRPRWRWPASCWSLSGTC